MLLNFVHHTSEVVNLLCFTWFLAPHFAYRKACSQKARQNCHCVEGIRSPHGLSDLPLEAYASFGVSEDRASTLSLRARSTDPSARAIASCVSPARGCEPRNLQF